MINIPTLTQLYDDIVSDLEAEFSITLPLIGRSFLRAIASVQAAKLKIYYLAIANLQKNIFVDTAEPEARGGTLERFGRVKINRDPFPARAGEYVVEVTGSIGATITGSTTFKSDDDSSNPGKLFILDNDYTLTAITDYITIRALEAGVESSLDYLDKLTATAPISLVNSKVAIMSASVEPAAEESIEAYRQVIIESYRIETQGGAAGDYRLWSFDAQGVKKVYPYTASGNSSTVNVYVEATVADSTDGKGTPSSGLLDDVEDVIELDPDTTLDINARGRRPMSTTVNVLPITVLEVEITITGYVGLTGDIETVIFDTLKTKLADIRPFVAGADVLEDKNDILDLNKIISIILFAKPGSIFTSVSMTVAGVPLSTFTFSNGDIANLDSVNYV